MIPCRVGVKGITSIRGVIKPPRVVAKGSISIRGVGRPRRVGVKGLKSIRGVGRPRRVGGASVISYKYIVVIAQIVVGTCPLTNKYRIACVEGFNLALLGDACAHNIIGAYVQVLGIGGTDKVRAVGGSRVTATIPAGGSRRQRLPAASRIKIEPRGLVGLEDQQSRSDITDLCPLRLRHPRDQDPLRGTL